MVVGEEGLSSCGCFQGVLSSSDTHGVMSKVKRSAPSLDYQVTQHVFDDVFR